MASNYSKRKRKYKGVKWIKTRFAKPYLRQCAVINAMGAASVAVSLAQISAIRSTSFTGHPLKAVAIAEAVIGSMQTLNNAQARKKELNGPYRQDK